MLTIAKGSAFQLKLFRLRLLFTQRGRLLIMCCLTCIYIKQTATGRFTSENASDLLQISQVGLYKECFSAFCRFPSTFCIAAKPP